MSTPDAGADLGAEEGPDVASLPGGAAAALEAVLVVADEPVPAVRLAAVLGLPVPQVRALLAELADEYAGAGGGRPRGFELREVAGGWRIWSSAAHGDVVGRFVLDGQQARLTQAALETLAVVAYRQPVTRGQVSAVRGVSVDGVMRTLTARGLVAEVGQDATTGAVLYGTTGYFLERLGLGTLDDLPPLAPYLPEVGDLDEAGSGSRGLRTAGTAGATARGGASGPPPGDEQGGRHDAHDRARDGSDDDRTDDDDE